MRQILCVPEKYLRGLVCYGLMNFYHHYVVYSSVYHIRQGRFTVTGAITYMIECQVTL